MSSSYFKTRASLYTPLTISFALGTRVHVGPSVSVTHVSGNMIIYIAFYRHAHHCTQSFGSLVTQARHCQYLHLDPRGAVKHCSVNTINHLLTLTPLSRTAVLTRLFSLSCHFQAQHCQHVYSVPRVTATHSLLNMFT